MKIFKTIVLICVINLPILAIGKTVNILTWWGYLNFPWVSSHIEHKCGITISFDQYYENQNFISRYEQNRANYDILIFESQDYEALSSILPNIKNSQLYKYAKSYNQHVKDRYLKEGYTHNIAYFFQSVTGFLWNKKNIDIDKEDSIDQVFNKAKNKLVSILNDPTYLRGLLKNINEHNSSLTQLINNNTVLITNNFYKSFYLSPLFAFAFQWSGSAVNYYKNLPKKARKNLYFTISPNYSIVSSDLIAQLNNKKSTSCVANILASKNFINKLQNDTYYFSPYINTKHVNSMFFKKLYRHYVKLLPQLRWVKPLPESLRKTIKHQWELIKLETTIKIQKNERDTL